MKGKINTDKGTMVVEFYEKDAPNTVSNFVKLTKEGFYNDLKFHRVIPNFVVQGGCPNGNGMGGPGYKIDCELGGGNQYHDKGVLSMAHAGRNTGGSQFFIMPDDITEHDWLNGVHTVFGKVISGCEHVTTLSEVETGAYDRPVIPVIITSATVSE